MFVLKLLYYLGWMIPLMYEVSSVTEADKHEQFQKYYKKREALPDDQKPEATTAQKLYPIFMIFYWLWCFIGLFTSQWLLFALVILLGFIPKNYRFVKQVDGALTIAVVMFALLNTFHFHINLLQYLESIL